MRTNYKHEADVIERRILRAPVTQALSLVLFALRNYYATGCAGRLGRLDRRSAQLEDLAILVSGFAQDGINFRQEDVLEVLEEVADILTGRR